MGKTFKDKRKYFGDYDEVEVTKPNKKKPRTKRTEEEIIKQMIEDGSYGI